MKENVDKEDIREVIDFLSQKNIPRLTNGEKVKEFEEKWGEWLGTKYNVMVNSGSAANELTMLALKYIYGEGQVILPPLTWISDVSSVIFSGLEPVFCDIHIRQLVADHRADEHDPGFLEVVFVLFPLFGRQAQDGPGVFKNQLLGRLFRVECQARVVLLDSPFIQHQVDDVLK